MSTAFPITLADVQAAQERLAPYLSPTPLRAYRALDEAVGAGTRVLVKHENHQPTNSFKVRNGLAAVSALPPDARRTGVVCASRGNHGLGVAYAGCRFDTAVTVVVPKLNNAEKNEAVRGFGATLVEQGEDYDEAVAHAERVARESGLALIHSTNSPHVIAGAATLTAEVVAQAPDLDAMVVAVGGGSQAVGAMVVLQALRPRVRVYAVQASGAPAIYESWKARRPIGVRAPVTFADGIATGTTYATTWPALRDGLADFVTVSDEEIAEAMRVLLRTTHNLPEPAGAAGLAGLIRLRGELAGKTVCVILSGGNVDGETLRRVLA